MSICLPVLNEDCSLVLAEGASIPSQEEDRVVLEAHGIQRTVSGPKDLLGCVSISSSMEAVEYLRFFSSWATVHLFKEQMLEVVEGRRPAYLYGPDGTCYTCLPPQRWHSLGLASPKVEQTPNGYVVTRYVVRPSPDDANASDLYRVTQRVASDGSVDLVKETPVPGLKDPERYGLAFPRYL